MNTSANYAHPLGTTLAAALIISIVGFLIVASRVSSSSVPIQERIFENKIPTHIPIKIKIKKEKEESFKDLKNEKWLREFELEVTNTGDKPIYFLYITMGTDVKPDGGPEIVFPLTYGRAELGDIVTKAASNDLPIKPGETYVLEVGEASAWERGVREKRWPESTKFRAELQVLSFGDGTGYFGTELYPPTRPKTAVKNDKFPPRNARGRPRKKSVSKLSAHSKRTSILTRPTFMSANFLSSESVINAAPSAVHPLVICQFPGCIPVVPWTGYVCYDNNPAKNACRIQNRPTAQMDGVCKQLEFKSIVCTAGAVDYFCQVINVYDCGFGPLPAPSPSPTPSPEPCLYCTDSNAVGPADCSNPSEPKCDPSKYQYEQNGCCYKHTCESAGVPIPPPPLPCPPGYFRSSDELQPFPSCNYLPCVPSLAVACSTEQALDCVLSLGQWIEETCYCDHSVGPHTPILVDTDGNGFDLTNAANGVRFTWRKYTMPQQTAWTAVSSDDAFLVLDRNGNGTIDDGRELFGNFTPQPIPPLGQERNGFLALAEYDKRTNGGNEDGLITPNDAIFTFLRLWQDRNHNGISESGELQTMRSVGLDTIDLDYKLSKHTDKYGNEFRYRAKIKDSNEAKVARWAWDIFLQSSGL